MPAVKRFDTRIRVDVSAEQDAWVKQQAAARLLSVAAVIRELIDADRRKEAQQP